MSQGFIIQKKKKNSLQKAYCTKKHFKRYTVVYMLMLAINLLIASLQYKPSKTISCTVDTA